MAILKLGAFTKSLRGKAGNTAFLETKLGTQARDVTYPTGEPSVAQQRVRINMEQDSAAWQALSVENAQKWRAFASNLTLKSKKAGKPFVPNGYQIFTAYTTKWLQVHKGGTPPVNPPTGTFAGDSLLFSVASGLGQVTWSVDKKNASGVVTELLLQKVKGKHRKAGKDGYVSQGFIAFTESVKSFTVPVPAGYYAAAYRFVEDASGRETAIVPLGPLTVSLSVADGGTGGVAAPKAPARGKKAA